MTGRWRGRQQRRGTTDVVSSRHDWRELIALAQRCAADARDGAAGADVELRLMTLARRSGSASVALLDKDAGATVADTSRAFLKLLTVFTRATTASVTRQAMAPVVEATAGFLDDQLHERAALEFQRAHEGRPEVWG